MNERQRATSHCYICKAGSSYDPTSYVVPTPHRRDVGSLCTNPRTLEMQFILVSGAG